MNIKQSFGKKIKEKRLSQHLTQEELAEKIGISPKSLSQIELGNNFISANNLEQICLALDIQAKNLFDFENENSKEKMEYIINKLKQNSSLLNKIYKIISIIE
ncbi:helix-turn-helix transcriptional regulator [bacterium]|nr:helix-turn-helix transcriptional regulator [bacterium]